MTYMYVHVPANSVPLHMQVVPLTGEAGEAEVQRIDQAITAYMSKYRQQFTALNADRREQCLKRFLRYLKSVNHSLQVSDLMSADGKAFLDSLVNTYTGEELSLAIKDDYKGALRSFSRFLADSRIVQTDVFFALKVE